MTIAVRDVDEPPSASPAPSVTGSSSTRLTVTWTVPENTGPPITDYDVQYRSFGGDFVDVAHDGVATGAGVTGLRRGTRYEVRVQAMNGEGTGPWSDRGSGGSGSGDGSGSGGDSGGDGSGSAGSGSGGEPPVPDEPPGQPDRPTLRAVSSGLLVTWTAPANAGPPSRTTTSATAGPRNRRRSGRRWTIP